MLDEILEYKEYTWNLNKPEDGTERIKYGTMVRGKAHFGGLERVLTIISRRFLYYYGDNATKSDCNAAFAAICAWLGFARSKKNYEKDLDEARKTEINAIYNWFHKYIGEVMLVSAGKDKTKLAKLKERQDYLRGGEFILKMENSCYTIGLGENNDFKILRLDKAVANGICRKRLKRFYLVCNNPFFEELTYKTKGGYEKLVVNGATAMKNRDMLLRVVATYLLENYYSAPDGIDSDRLVFFNLTNFSNWQYYHKSYKKDVYDTFYYKGNKLIEKFDPAKHDNQVKIKINRECREWFDKCEWNLIEATDNDDKLEEYLKEHPGYCFYRDDGAGKPLGKNKRYDRTI